MPKPGHDCSFLDAGLTHFLKAKTLNEFGTFFWRKNFKRQFYFSLFRQFLDFFHETFFSNVSDFDVAATIFSPSERKNRFF
jgi:hypothetical protein